MVTIYGSKHVGMILDEDRLWIESCRNDSDYDPLWIEKCRNDPYDDSFWMETRRNDPR